jgi:hypothetical protein
MTHANPATAAYAMFLEVFDEVRFDPAVSHYGLISIT